MYTRMKTYIQHVCASSTPTVILYYSDHMSGTVTKYIGSERSTQQAECGCRERLEQCQLIFNLLLDSAMVEMASYNRHPGSIPGQSMQNF